MKKLFFLLVSISLFAQPKKIYFFGDSITYGAGVLPSQNYPTLLAKELGMEEINYAIRGTCMMSQTPSCRVDCRHMEYFCR